MQSFWRFVWGSRTPAINWRSICHRICRGNCAKWLNVRWNFGISDLGKMENQSTLIKVLWLQFSSTVYSWQGAYMNRARPLEPGPELPWARSQARSGPGPRPGAGSPGLGPRLQGPGPAHVSALLTMYVCIFFANLCDFTGFYNILRYFMLILL